MAIVDGRNIVLLNEKEIIALASAGGKRKLGYSRLDLDVPESGQATAYFDTGVNVSAICHHINTIAGAGEKEVLRRPLDE
jgi:hypothetical protein